MDDKLDDVGQDAIFLAREYQVELFEKAVEDNTIVCLKTGAGKTFIAILLIKELQHEILKPYSEGAKRTFFLVPKVPLVMQQANAIKEHTILKVGCYYGAMGVDYWDEGQWLSQLENNHVLVMTAQILVNVLQSGYMPLNRVNLLIFDECHLATGNHPYCVIMSRYRDFSDRPRVLGLTASILNGKCSPVNVESQMRNLETVLYSHIETATDLNAVNRYATKPKEAIIECDPFPEEGLLESKVAKCVYRGCQFMQPIIDATKNKEAEFPTSEVLTAKKTLNLHEIFQFLKLIWNDTDANSDVGEYSTAPDALLKYVNGIMRTLGLWCTKFAVDRFLEDIPHLRSDANDQMKENVVLLYDIAAETLNEVKGILETSFSMFPKKDIIINAVTPKVKRLVELLEAIRPRLHGNEQDGVAGAFRGIIFVEQRIIAWILSEYLQQLRAELPEQYWFLIPTYVVGHGFHVLALKKVGMNVTRQNDALHSFRTGACNLIVATQVVEEGLDIPKCNIVVRFDPPKTFCSYVQSMGRARAEKAFYALLADSVEKSMLINDVTVYKIIECLLNLKSHNRSVPDDDDVEHYYENFHSVPPYYPAGRDGAVVTMDTAMFLLYRYCTYMPKDRYTQLVPRFRYERNRENIREIRCVVTVPFCTAIKERIVGQYMKDKKLARKAAAHQACILLHLAGELNDHLQPAVNYTERYQNQLGIISMENLKEGDPIPGTAKRRQVYEKQMADDLSEAFPNPDEKLFLYSIVILEKEDSRQHEPGCFGILTCKPLHDVCPFQLFGRAKLRVHLLCVRNSVTLSVMQLHELENFHCFLFREVLLLASSAMEYCPKLARCSFLIVPLTRGKDCKYTINWEFLSRYSVKTNQSLIGTNSVINEGDVITPQYGPKNFQKKRFYVIEVRYHLTPESPFPSPEYPSFAAYFKKKYNCNIIDRGQPLLLVDYAPNTLNLLHPRASNGTSSNEQRLQYLIPELCLSFPLNIKELRQALCLPCILHRLNGLLLARQLGNRIIEEGEFLPFKNDGHLNPIPLLEDLCQSCKVVDDVIFRRVQIYDNPAARLNALLFQSLTTSSADNWSDLERLEVVGDSFLKFSVSAFLFCTFKNLNEGALSMLRTGMVKNFTLFCLATLKGFPQLLNAQAFQPRIMWLPPCFVIPNDLREALCVANIPFHLWPFATVDDVVKHAPNTDKWSKELLDRWSVTDPGSRDSPVTKAVSSSCLRLCYSNDDDDDDAANDGDNANTNIAFDPYTQQLISDKTVADSAEAMIGAILILCGHQAALEFINWLGLFMKPEFYPWNPPTTAFVVPLHMVNQNEIYAGLDELEANLGYTFNDKSFLRQAIIHPSYTRQPATNNYQKLEFLGDSILDFLITMHLYKMHPDLSPGDMTDLRSSLVDNVTFGYLTVTHKIHKHMKYSSVNLYQAIERYISHVKLLKHPKDAVYLIKEDETLEMEEIEVPKVLGDIFEAVAGAIFIDSGLSLKAVWDAYYPMMKDVIDQYCVSLPINPIRVLMEAYPATVFSKPVYDREAETYTVNCICKGITYKGLSKNKTVAKQAAAKCALRELGISATRTLS